MSIRPKSSPIDEIAMSAAERKFARADALVHGAIFVLQGTERSMWGPGIALEVAIDLLEEAREQRGEALSDCRRAKHPKGNKS